MQKFLLEKNVTTVPGTTITREGKNTGASMLAGYDGLNDSGWADRF